MQLDLSVHELQALSRQVARLQNVHGSTLLRICKVAGRIQVWTGTTKLLEMPPMGIPETANLLD